MTLVHFPKSSVPRCALLLGAALLASTNALGQTTERVSVSSAGVQSNGGSNRTSASGDGRYVVFYSLASNLVAVDINGWSDIFVHDRETSVTQLVSIDSSGNQGTGGHSDDPAISADGRYVAFDSSATNLVLGDTNGAKDIFVHDRQTGLTQRVSIDSAGNQGTGSSANPAISGDGRYVAFESNASNLVPGDTNSSQDVFVHDRQTGVTTRASLDSAGIQGNNASLRPAISEDGRFAAFESFANNLVLGDTNNSYDVFVRDLQTGVTTRVSVDSSGNQGNSLSDYPAISGDGRYVAFESFASNLVAGDTNAGFDIFLHDRQTGVTERTSLDSAGNQGNAPSAAPVVSEDGRYVSFESAANNLVAGDTNSSRDVFLHDRLTHATERVSLDSAFNQGNFESTTPAISGNGHYVFFESAANNLVAGDTNGIRDIFVRDRCSDLFVSYCTAGTSASNCSATLSSSGFASSSAPSGFVVTASFVEGQKDGLFFFGQNGRQANSWGNGTSYQCVVPPVKRAGVQPGNGTNDACDQMVSQDLNARWCPTCPKPNHSPVAGLKLQIQYWYRDPANTSNQSTSLSDAIEVSVCP